VSYQSVPNFPFFFIILFVSLRFSVFLFLFSLFLDWSISSIDKEAVWGVPQWTSEDGDADSRNVPD
jgi:hypothetical protein